MEHAPLHARARQKGVNPLIYWLVRGVLQPFFHLYFRLSRIGREHIPDGPVILASNHRSFLDPFIIATLARRPLYYVAKEELFRSRFTGWLLNNLGAFPVRRGAERHGHDRDREGDPRPRRRRADLPRGHAHPPRRARPPARGVGRLALETGAPVVPVAIIGTEAVRKGWRIRPHKVRVRVGRALTFPQVQAPSRTLAAAVTDRIWPCVMLQWEWLGGLPPLRRAAVIGAGSWGTAVAVMLARAGLEVDLGCRTAEQANQIAASGRNDDYLPGVELPESITVMRAADLELSRHDLVAFAVPSAGLPSAVAAHARLDPAPRRRARDVEGPRAAARHAAVRVRRRARQRLGGRRARRPRPRRRRAERRRLARRRRAGPRLRPPGHHRADRRRLRRRLHARRRRRRARRLRQERRRARRRGRLAPPGPNAAGAAAGKVFAEIDALARHEGSAPETFAGLAGAGDLVATVLAEGSRNRRAGEMLAEGMPAEDIDSALGQTAEAVACVPLLAERVQAAGVDAPTLRGLAGVIEGELDAAEWTESLTAPRPTPEAPAEGPRRVACDAWRTESTPKARLDADFSELYKAHLRDVYSYSYYRVGNHHDAEDLTEQTFLQAYRHFERAQRESEGRPLRPWLIRIAHNLAANYYRDRSRKPQTPIDDASTISATAHDRGAGRGPRRPEADPRVCPGPAGRPPRGADHALRARDGQPRDRAGARPHRRRHQGVAAPSHQAARGARAEG